ncbi:beta-galactosidase [Clostridia bacterium]|nr:beta-galactosidase [Clostridia bacterium]
MKRHPPIITKVPHMIHGADYNPEQWLSEKDTVWQEDMRLAKLAGMNSLSVGIFSWAALEPEEGKYTFEWLDEVMDNLADNGLTAVLATPSGARPAWLAHKYPEVLRVNGNLERIHFEGRHNHCLTSPVYREKVTEINTRLARRYKSHPALGLWHVSNEYSGECHCELCQEKFREYLKAKYKTLDACNKAWWSAFWSHTYTDWAQIESPHDKGEHSIHGLTLDWKRFTTEQTVDFYLRETAPLKKITPGVPCTTNLMAGYTGLDYARLSDVLDVVSWDNYPEWRGDTRDIGIACYAAYCHDLMYGLKRKPFLLMESSPSATNWRSVAKLHRPGTHILQSIQAVAHGADSVQYFQMRKGRGGSEKFHGAVIDHNHAEAQNTRVFREVAEVGGILAGLDEIVGTAKPSKVAIIFDYNNEWAVGDIKGALQGGTGYSRTVHEHYSVFWSAGIPVDIVDERASLDGYALVIAPMTYMLRCGFAEKVTAFVDGGGAFVTTYLSGYVNETDLCWNDGFPVPLKETLGIWSEELDALYPEDRNSVEWNGKSYEAYGLCELIHAQAAEVLGVYGGDFYKGRPALTVNKFGRGGAYYIAARTGTDFLRDFYARLISEARIECYSAPTEGVSVQVRSDGERTWLFALNFTEKRKTVKLNSGADITLDPRGYRVVEL